MPTPEIDEQLLLVDSAIHVALHQGCTCGYRGMITINVDEPGTAVIEHRGRCPLAE